MNRRNNKCAWTVVLLWTVCPSSTNAQGKNPKKDADPLPALAKSLQIEIVTLKPTFPVKTANGEINGKAAEATTLERYIPVFAAEFKLYPIELIKQTALKRVIIAAEVSFAGQLRSAIPDWEHDTLYLDAARGANNKTYLRKVIHHEYFHLIDYRDDGLIYKDERWANLNPKNFKYGTGGKNAQDNASTSVLTDKYPGFLNHYSTTGVEEDKAEIFANLMVDAKYVDERIKNDAVLKAKTQRMRELMKSFCPQLTDKFWDNARKLARD